MTCELDGSRFKLEDDEEQKQGDEVDKLFHLSSRSQDIRA